MKLGLFSIIIATTMLSAASAQASSRDIYLVGNLGINFANGDTSFPRTEPASFDIDYDTGFGGGVGIGYRFSDYFRSDVQVNFQTSDYSTKNNKYFGATIPDTFVENLETTVTTAMINGYAELPLDKSYMRSRSTYDVPGYKDPYSFSLYAGAGVGMAYSSGDVGGAYQLMGGASYKINDNMTVDLGYKYLDTLSDIGESFLEQDFVTGEPRKLKYDIDFDANIIETQLRLSF